jgi:hypothetical protein
MSMSNALFLNLQKEPFFFHENTALKAQTVLYNLDFLKQNVRHFILSLCWQIKKSR